jgi:hypothetical protein
MAKFRLLAAHQLRNTDLKADVLLLGDKETEHLGDERGTLVGDGTPYPVVHATLEMLPLDAEAEAMLNVERERLSRNHASMNPIDQLPVVLAQLTGGRDDYDDRYLPGFPGVPRPQKGPHLVEDKS